MFVERVSTVVNNAGTLASLKRAATVDSVSHHPLGPDGYVGFPVSIHAAHALALID